MPVTDITTDPENLTMTLVADAAAPVSRLWDAFTDPRKLERFWGPPGWPAAFTSFDLRPGGRVDYHMTSPQGQHAGGSWEVLNVDEGRSFEVLDSFVDENGDKRDGFPSMRMTFVFEETPEGSRLTNTTYFTSAEALEQVVAMGAIEGSRLAINQLDAVLQSLREYAQGKGTRTEILSDQHVRITRLIEAPAALVWRAHHEPDLLKKWMLGPDGWTMPVAEVATEVGDSYRNVWAPEPGTEGEEFGFEGELVYLEPGRRSVTTERMIGMDGPGTVNDLTLYEEDGATLLTLLIEYPDAATRDMILATGMTDGMEASYARLEEVVAAG